MESMMKFKYFLRDTTNLSDRSISRYTLAIDTISNATKLYINRSINLYDIRNFIEAKKIIEQINLSDKFIEKNIKGREMYTSSLKWFLKYLEVDLILNFLAWNDRNGVYKIEDRVLHDFICLSYEESIRYFFGVLNDDVYYKFADNIFELSYDKVISIAREEGIYRETIEKLKVLLEYEGNSEDIYRSLI